MATIQIKEIGSNTWHDLPEPSFEGLTPEFHAISSPNSGRDNNSGTMHIDIVARKRKYICTWKNIPESVVNTIFNLTNSPFFYVRCTKDLSGSTYEGVFYRGQDVSAQIYSVAWGKNQNQTLYSSFSIDLIER